MGDIGEPRRHFEVLPEWPWRAEPQQAPTPIRVPELPREPDAPRPSEPVR